MMDRPEPDRVFAGFASDNTAPATPEVMAALVAANRGAQPAYGDDEITARLERKLAELFEHEVAVIPVSTGTAANALSLAACTTPWGIVFCHHAAHVNEHEAGAPEFFSGGARLVPLGGEHGKIALDALGTAIAASGFGVVHESQPQAVTITQASEVGTLYRLDEIRAIAELAHGKGMKLHMDGARFANAVAALGVSPADLTWRAGIDIMSFGATKNGAIAAEAIVAFDPALAAELGFRRKRAGHLLSKQRYLSAQIEAGLIDGRWLGWARHANEMAAALAQGLVALGCATLLHPVEANEIFVRLPEPVLAGLERDGFAFHRRPAPNRQIIRLVTSWNIAPDAIDSFLARARHHAEGRMRDAR
jgi:threonine aldolase